MIRTTISSLVLVGLVVSVVFLGRTLDLLPIKGMRELAIDANRRPSCRPRSAHNDSGS